MEKSDVASWVVAVLVVAAIVALLAVAQGTPGHRDVEDAPAARVVIGVI